MRNEPSLCRPQAFYFFAYQLTAIDTTVGLLNSALAVSMHALDDVDPKAVLAELQGLAQRVRRRVRSRNPQALLAHLHDVLFDEEAFSGNHQDYYDPSNNYLSHVLQTRCGIPITLCLIYKVVAEGVGLNVEGVNAPGHFLARVKTAAGTMIVDPFFAGGVLTDEEAFDRMERITGRATPRISQYLAPAQHAQWVSRMLVNLQHIFASEDRRGDLAAMGELQCLLDYSIY
jgi:regulator of sirC expression with transglutaminase-like and TPR domain